MFWNWESGPKLTSISEPESRVTLPGQWSQAPSPDSARWSYHTEAKNEQLTVSMPLVIAQQMSRDERVEGFKRVVEIRRRVETKMPGFAAVAVTEPTFGEADRLLAARYGGVDSERQRRFHCLLLGSTRVVMIFYYEAVDMPESQSEGRAKAIFNSVVVRP